MAKIKAFSLGGTEGFLPLSWLTAVDAPRHIQQGEAVAYAFSKADLAGMLEDRGLSRHAADQMVKCFRLGPGGSGWALLVDAGVIDPTRAGIYAAHDLVKGSKVIEVPATGEPRVIAVMGYESGPGGRGLYVIPVT